MVTRKHIQTWEMVSACDLFFKHTTIQYKTTLKKERLKIMRLKVDLTIT